MRKLATIRIIDEIIPIPWATRIEVARINNWTVIVKRWQFKKGELAVFFEPDSFIPEHIAYNLKKTTFSGKKGARIKALKLRDLISQGFILSLEEAGLAGEGVYEGKDVTDALGVLHYNPPLAALGPPAGHRPAEIPATSINRIQNLSNRELAEFLSSAVEMEITEKLDGMSGGYVLKIDYHGITRQVYAGQHLIKQGPNVAWGFAKANFLFERMIDNDLFNIVIQGEFVGQKIKGATKNQYKLKDQRFYVYNIYNLKTKVNFTITQCHEICDQLELNYVPVVSLPNYPNYKMMDVYDWLSFSCGNSRLNTEKLREGIVIRVGNERIKVISPEFLITNKL